MDRIIINNLNLILNNNRILNDINLSFENNRIYGLVGRNGAGKTMLIRCIANFIIPTSGEIIIDGKNINKNSFKNEIGIILETPGFINSISGFKNLQILASINNKISKDKIINILKTVGLFEVKDKVVGHYSLGMKQRLGIAQAIMENQSILLLDEPMNGLDNSGVKEIRQLLLSLKNEKTVIILASHYKEDINYLCDKVIEMDKGIIV